MRSAFIMPYKIRFAEGVSRLVRHVTAASLAFSTVCLIASPARAAPVTIDWVTVGNPGNAADTNFTGAVSYQYQIGKYEVTIQQWTDFLNVAAKSDPYGLYNPSMASDLNAAGISRAGTSGSYTYSVINNGGNSGNRPITFVSWFDAARFANWLQNGQGSGSTETGAYTLVGGQTSGTAPVRNPGAQFYIPTNDEWYKAAYYSPLLNSGSGGYFTYATQSNSAPGNVIGGGVNQANYITADNKYSVTQSTIYSSSANYLSNVGAFTNSASYYGTFDQTGNVAEWNDFSGTTADTTKGIRGGAWNNFASNVTSSTLLTPAPSTEISRYGFRLAAPTAVPEPSTYAMALAAIACGGFSMWRRRRSS